MYQLKPQQFIAFTERSHAWDMATLRINQIVDEHNRMGVPITPQKRQALHESRLLYILQQEPELFQEVAGEMYHQLLQKRTFHDEPPLFP